MESLHEAPSDVYLKAFYLDPCKFPELNNIILTNIRICGIKDTQKSRYNHHIEPTYLKWYWCIKIWLQSTYPISSSISACLDILGRGSQEWVSSISKGLWKEWYHNTIASKIQETSEGYRCLSTSIEPFLSECVAIWLGIWWQECFSIYLVEKLGFESECWCTDILAVYALIHSDSKDLRVEGFCCWNIFHPSKLDARQEDWLQYHMSELSPLNNTVGKYSHKHCSHQSLLWKTSTMIFPPCFSAD